MNENISWTNMADIQKFLLVYIYLCENMYSKIGSERQILTNAAENNSMGHLHIKKKRNSKDDICYNFLLLKTM